MAIPVVEERLGAVSDPLKRSHLALHIAETYHECFSIEKLFRELITCAPKDDDGILTALVDSDIAFGHISNHIQKLKKPLVAAIRTVDSHLQGASKRKKQSKR